MGRTRFARNDGLRIAYERRGGAWWSRQRPWLVLVLAFLTEPASPPQDGSAARSSSQSAR